MKTTVEMAREAVEHADVKWPLRPRGEQWKRCRDERLITLARSAEREACAQVVDKMLTDSPIGNHPRTEALFFAARNIRARGNT